MRDDTGDEIVVTALPHTIKGVSLRVSDSTSAGDGESVTAGAMLSAKKARKLAKKLLAAADEIDGVESRTPVPEALPVRVRLLEAALQELHRGSRVAARAVTAQDAEIAKLRAEQHWDREQITALLAVLGAQREREAEEGDGNATPVDNEIHYLLPRSWILENTRNLNTSKAGSVTFEIPAGTHLRDRVSTGFAP